MKKWIYRDKDRVLIITEYSLSKDIGFAIDSGKPFDSVQYILLDYDKFNPILEFYGIMKKYSLKRGLIVKSSENKYHALSFTPTPINKIFEILWNSHVDRRHAASFLRFGRLGLRIYPKNGEMPKIIKVLNNPKGKNFYNYSAEEMYRYALEENYE